MEGFDQMLQQDVEKTMSTIFLHVLFNWNKIKENEQVMNCLDMNTNSLCRKLKQSNPSQRDGYVQAHTLSFLFMMVYIMNISTQNLINTGSNLLGHTMIQSVANTLMTDSNNNQSNQHVDSSANWDNLWITEEFLNSDDLLPPGDSLD